MLINNYCYSPKAVKPSFGSKNQGLILEKGRFVADGHGNLVKTNEKRKFIPPSEVKNVENVDMNEMGYGEYDKGRLNYMTTDIFLDCIAVTLYDPQKQAGVMAHLGAARNSAESTQNLIRKMEEKGSGKENLEARVFGGVSGSSIINSQLREISGSLKNNGIKIAEQDVLYDKPGHIVMDLETGKVFGTDLARIYDFSEGQTETEELPPNELWKRLLG